MRLGIYSGTFDPIHEGHILFAQVAIEQFGLDEVVFLVEEKPRYKQTVTAVEHRQAMLRLATADQSLMHLFDHELEPSHTFEGVLNEMTRHYPDDEYYLVMGGDVFQHIAKWGERSDERGSVQQVGHAIGFIVGVTEHDQLQQLTSIQEALNLNVRFIEAPLGSISSRVIRQRIKEKNHAIGLDADVQRYIQANQLYQA